MPKMTIKSKTSKFFEALAVAVAGGSSVRNAAASVGCSESVAYHMSCTREFRDRVSEIRSEITAETIGILTRGSTLAATTLLELLDVANEPRDRLAAAKSILASLGPITDVHEIRHRLNEIEKSQQIRIAQ